MKQRGFTLVELMIVIVIIGILAAWAIPSYISYTMRAARFDGQALASQVMVLAQNYYIRSASYPQDLNELTGSSNALLSDNGHYKIQNDGIGECETGVALTRCVRVTLTAESELANRLMSRLGSGSVLWVKSNGETSADWSKDI